MLSDWLVDQVMQLGGIPAFFSLGYSQNLVASLCKTLQRVVNVGRQVGMDYKLAFNRQGLIHIPILLHPPRNVAHPAPHSSPSSVCTALGVSCGKDR
jgi:hypothetical protein